MKFRERRTCLVCRHQLLASASRMRFQSVKTSDNSTESAAGAISFPGGHFPTQKTLLHMGFLSWEMPSSLFQNLMIGYRPL
jgi:hypothetical protein